MWMVQCTRPAATPMRRPDSLALVDICVPCAERERG
jgi:hypothetical protein